MLAGSKQFAVFSGSATKGDLTGSEEVMCADAEWDKFCGFADFRPNEIRTFSNALGTPPEQLSRS